MGRITCLFPFRLPKGRPPLLSFKKHLGKYSGTLKETAANGIRENGVIVDGVSAVQDPDGIG
jgi:hypothetical protein